MFDQDGNESDESEESKAAEEGDGRTSRRSVPASSSSSSSSVHRSSRASATREKTADSATDRNGLSSAEPVIMTEENGLTDTKLDRNSKKKRKRKSGIDKYRVLLGLWRKECSTVSTRPKQNSDSPQISVCPRPLHAWADFITAGLLNLKFRRSQSEGAVCPDPQAPTDPWGVEQLILDHVQADWQENRSSQTARKVVNDFLSFEDDIGTQLVTFLQHTFRSFFSLIPDIFVTIYL